MAKELKKNQTQNFCQSGKVGCSGETLDLGLRIDSVSS